MPPLLLDSLRADGSITVGEYYMVPGEGPTVADADNRYLGDAGWSRIVFRDARNEMWEFDHRRMSLQSRTMRRGDADRRISLAGVPADVRFAVGEAFRWGGVITDPITEAMLTSDRPYGRVLPDRVALELEFRLPVRPDGRDPNFTLEGLPIAFPVGDGRAWGVGRSHRVPGVTVSLEGVQTVYFATKSENLYAVNLGSSTPTIQDVGSSKRAGRIVDPREFPDLPAHITLGQRFGREGSLHTTEVVDVLIVEGPTASAQQLTDYAVTRSERTPYNRFQEAMDGLSPGRGPTGTLVAGL